MTDAQPAAQVGVLLTAEQLDELAALEGAAAALAGVIKVADRKTVEFDAAHEALAAIRKALTQ